ncbi:unnamed protein product, partial [Staurois parvus]
QSPPRRRISSFQPGSEEPAEGCKGDKAHLDVGFSPSSPDLGTQQTQIRGPSRGVQR